MMKPRPGKLMLGRFGLLDYPLGEAPNYKRIRDFYQKVRTLGYETPKMEEKRSNKPLIDSFSEKPAYERPIMKRVLEIKSFQTKHGLVATGSLNDGFSRDIWNACKNSRCHRCHRPKVEAQWREHYVRNSTDALFEAQSHFWKQQSEFCFCCVPPVRAPKVWA